MSRGAGARGAGVSATAVAYSSTKVRIATDLIWPEEWQGAEILRIYKKKGDPHDCDALRGILLESHAGKALKGVLKDHINDHYNAHIPEEQFGATAGRGTDFATHIVTTMAAMAEAAGWSIFNIFVNQGLRSHHP